MLTHFARVRNKVRRLSRAFRADETNFSLFSHDKGGAPEAVAAYNDGLTHPPRRVGAVFSPHNSGVRGVSPNLKPGKEME
jgi:hypothetical protein